MGELSLGRQEAFEIFRRDYEHNDAIEENKKSLKQRYAEAKRLGEIVNQSRSKISGYIAGVTNYRIHSIKHMLPVENGGAHVTVLT